MPAPDAADAARIRAARRFLAGFWVAWALWLIFRPIEGADSPVSPDARFQLAIFGFAILFFVAYGLFREWRWPVTASRALVAALIVAVLIGPAKRDAWIYALDVVFAVAGFVPAFLVIKLGVAPPPKRSSEMLERRIQRRQERIRRRMGGR